MNKSYFILHKMPFLIYYMGVLVVVSCSLRFKLTWDIIIHTLTTIIGRNVIWELNKTILRSILLWINILIHGIWKCLRSTSYWVLLFLHMFVVLSLKFEIPIIDYMKSIIEIPFSKNIIAIFWGAISILHILIIKLFL